MAVGVGVAGPQLYGATGVRADERVCRNDAVRSHVGHLFSVTDSTSGDLLAIVAINMGVSLG